MTFAFGHLIGAWIPGKIYEKIKHIKLSHYTWFFLILGGILPDADFILEWTLHNDAHRTFTHSIFFLITAPLFIYLFFKYLKHNKESSQYALALASGIAMHLVLDMATSYYGIPLFWPNLTHISFYHIGLIDHASPSFLDSSAQNLHKSLKLAIIDMGLGTTWIFYLWYKKQVQF